MLINIPLLINVNKPRFLSHSQTYSQAPAERRIKPLKFLLVHGRYCHSLLPASREDMATPYKPTDDEVRSWFLYGLCSYFVHTAFIPIMLPIIISQSVPDSEKHTLYEELFLRTTKIGNKNFSPLKWTSISWITGLILSAPILSTVSILVDYNHYQRHITGAASVIGALLCLPAGFIRNSWIFPPYIAAIVAANAVVGAAHARHLGLMIRGFTGSTTMRQQFANRISFGSWLSIYSTAAGCLGVTVLTVFTYFALNQSLHSSNLWVVPIFSGLTWGLGVVHIFFTNRVMETHNRSNSAHVTHVLSVFRYPRAAGSLAAVFLSSFTSMCIFGAGFVYALVYIRSPNIFLLLWLIYFMVPILSLLLAYSLQQTMKLDAEIMQLLGFILSTSTSGFGFYYRTAFWNKGYFVFFGALQGTATGLLHAYGRVVWMNCSPEGKEGAFSVWFSWALAVGACAGFAVATVLLENVGTAFGISFCGGIVGVVVLIFGIIKRFREEKAAEQQRLCMKERMKLKFKNCFHF